MKLQTKINIRFPCGYISGVFCGRGTYSTLALDKVVNQNIREMLESRKAYIILSLQAKSTDQRLIRLESTDHSIFIKRIVNSTKRIQTLFGYHLPMIRRKKN